MDKDQSLRVVTNYIKDLYSFNIMSKRHLDLDINNFDMSKDRNSMLEHSHWMCEQMISQCDDYDNNIEKVMRWLGFVQGIFWTTGFYSIDKMRTDNRIGN